MMSAPDAQFFGLDLTSSPKKPSAYAALDDKLYIVDLGFSGSDPEIVAAVDRAKAALVAIDAPLSMPKGLCCLQEICSCQELLPLKGRACERELAKLGIGCFFTTKKSIIKKMIYRAINLKGELAVRGHQVIEIYPYATKVLLWGRNIPKKTTPEGLDFLQESLTTLIHDLEREAIKSHDQYDAIVAAYTAYLYCRGLAEAVGDTAEGQIFIPKLKIKA